MAEATVAFIGLGNMGMPMARRLLDAGHSVLGYDAAEPVRAAFADDDRAAVAESAPAAVAAASVVILMLPSSAIVEAVLLDEGVLERIPAGATLIDMGSSEPLRTRALAERAGALGVELLDAPVSGGVRGALDGTLTIMVGGAQDSVERWRPMLEALGRRVLHVGETGAGHALKALNNLLSASHLLASVEAVKIGRAFGLDPQVMVDAINTSTGRSASTERKLPEFILNEQYGSGFTLRLMVKDVGIAVALGEGLGLHPALAEQVLAMWQEAADALPADADHTEIARWIG
jgi:3-hydroxyisobutyrate dehydrogenase